MSINKYLIFFQKKPFACAPKTALTLPYFTPTPRKGMGQGRLGHGVVALNMSSKVIPEETFMDTTVRRLPEVMQKVGLGRITKSPSGTIDVDTTGKCGFAPECSDVMILNKR
jgi:hypothetical protein